MVFHKKYKTPRKYTKKYTRKSYRKPKVPRLVKTNVHLLKRTFLQTETVTTAAFAPLFDSGGGTLTPFRLSDLPNYTELTSLYDEYKVKGISLKFIFSANTSQAGTTTATHLPSLLSIYDKNDIILPASESEMLEYASFKVSRLDYPQKRYFTPYVDSYNGQYETMKWTATTQDTLLRGMKYAVTHPLGSGTSGVGILKIYVTYYIALRTPK